MKVLDTQKYTWTTVKIFWRHAMKYWWASVVIGLGIVLVTIGDAYRPFLFKSLVDIGWKAFNMHDQTATTACLWIVLKLGILGMATQVVWRTIGLTNAWYQPRLIADLTNTGFVRILSHSMKFFNENFVGSIVNRIRRYGPSFETIDDQIKWNFSKSILWVAISLYVFFKWYHPIFGKIMSVWSLIYVCFSVCYSKYVKMPHDIASADQDTKVTGKIADSIGNVATIKAFSGENQKVADFRKETELAFELRHKSWRMGQWAEVFQGVSIVILNTAVLYLAVARHEQYGITLGDLVLFNSYMGRMVDNLWDVGRYIRQTFEALANANELTAMLELPREIVDIPDAPELEIIEGAISFRNVTFGYETGRSTLKNFSLDVKGGEVLALVGESGAGKSTVGRLLLRISDVDEGGILIDGQDIRKVSQESLRNSIALVAQDTSLFHSSLYDNTKFGRPDASLGEVIEASKFAHSHPFIETFEKKYDTYVGERGVKLSGGQRQRVAIARAITKNAPIIFFDEATSALDSESEAMVQQAIKELIKGKTMIVIAHRLSTIMQADRIVVMKDGEIVEMGTHKELLLKDNGVYRCLWERQAGGFIPSGS